MTPRTFFNIQQGFFEQWELENQGSWERARWLATVIVNPHVKKNLQPKDLTTFPWERKRKRKEVDYKQVKAEAELYKKKVEFQNKLKKQQNG